MEFDDLLRVGPFATALFERLDDGDLASLACVSSACRVAVADERKTPAPQVVPFPPGAFVSVCPAQLRSFVCSDDRAKQFWWAYDAGSGVLATRDGDRAVVWSAQGRRVEVDLTTQTLHARRPNEHLADYVTLGLYDGGRKLGVVCPDEHVDGVEMFRIYDTADGRAIDWRRQFATRRGLKADTSGDTHVMVARDGELLSVHLDAAFDAFGVADDASGWPRKVFATINTIPALVTQHVPIHDYMEMSAHDRFLADLAQNAAVMAQPRNFGFTVQGLPWTTTDVSWASSEDEVTIHPERGPRTTNALQIAVGVDVATKTAVVRAVFMRDGTSLGDRPSLTLVTWRLREGAPAPLGPPDALRELVAASNERDDIPPDFVTEKTFTNVRLNVDYVSYERPTQRRWSTELCVQRCDELGGCERVFRARRRADVRVDLPNRVVTVADPVARQLTVFSI